jgi:hypothetical protein
MFQTFFEVEKKEKSLFEIKNAKKRSIMFSLLSPAYSTTCTTLARSHTAAALNGTRKNKKPQACECKLTRLLP